ncbi:hypothetical protein K439DRAFT_1633508 [Ramaria rubella]|nr:hypothetical protein K439DRAFT_1633508 [Ramaria rubella]
MGDRTNTFESLSTVLTSLAESPYSLELHAKHIQLASTPELIGQAEGAAQLFTDFYAATDQVWLPFLQQKLQNIGISRDFDTIEEPVLVDLQETNLETILDVLESFRKAESDYLSIPILCKEIKLLTLLHASYVATSNPDLEPLLSEDAVRLAISAAALQGSWHLTQGHLLWDMQIAWEFARLAEKAHKSEQEALKVHIDTLHRDRLKQPHSTHEATMQSYSSFVSAYYGPDEYEARLVVASKLRAGPAKAWDNKERYELSLGSPPPLDKYQTYILSERRAKMPNNMLLRALHERAISDFASRRWNALISDSDSQTVAYLENALRSLWCSYVDSLQSEDVEEHRMPVLRRAVRSVPSCGEVWSKYIRTLERLENVSEDAIENGHREIVPDVYARALATSLIQKSVEQIIPLVLAKAGYEKRHLKNEEDFQSLVKTLENGMTMIRKATKGGDPLLTLEKFLSGVFMNLESPLTEQALALWQSTTKHYKSSSLAWSKYLELLIAEHEYSRARALFKEMSQKKMDWPDAIWQLWVDFEQLYGFVEDIEYCLEKVKILSEKLEKQREQEAMQAQQAWIDASRLVVEPQEAGQSVADTAATPMNVSTGTADPQQDFNRKRKAEEHQGPDISSKRPRFDDKADLKRDRENSTVFVSSLASGTTKDELLALFKDCGDIREIKLTKTLTSLVATVEFMERGCVPAALTKDKKRVQGNEITVHLAWQSTLYVTNFPEATDDTGIRELFGQHGEIFDVRWPSKKYKSTRRFCYIQYTSPSAAASALSLHGHEYEAGRSLTVHISNPERKQERSDASANAREIYVAGLSQSVNQNDLRKLFEPFGTISGIRLILDDKGNAKGFGFVEFEDKDSANAALAANNQELKKRRIAVTLADTRAQPRQREGSAIYQARRSRTLRVKNLSPGTQEGLLQQALEKHAKVSRIEVFHKKNEAIVELVNVAEAGRLLLNKESIIFDNRTLEFIEEDLPASTRESARSGSMFVPRGAAGRPRAGIGSKKTISKKSVVEDPGTSARVTESGAGKGQDDFRRMVNSGV